MLENKILKGKILLLSGLHIGGSDAGVKIGGIDSPVIKNPISGMPYIPGSSLKGKTRFLLEHYYNVVPDDGSVSKPRHNGKDNPVAVIYGHIDKDTNTQPTRVIFRDANIIGALKNLGNPGEEGSTESIIDPEKAKAMMGSIFTEAKTEVVIDRTTGTVSTKGGPRQIERVPAGTVFDFELTLRVFDSGEANLHQDIILKGLKLLQNDALGGHGSRGSGRIMFFDLTLDDKKMDLEEVKL